MIQANPANAITRIVDTIIELAGCAKAHRIIVAGSKSRELLVELHERGYTRVATTTTYGFPLRRCHVALVDWRLESLATSNEP